MALRRFSILVLIVFAACIPCAGANEPILAKDASYYVGAKEQKFYRLKNAKVAWVDFELVRADFPAIRELSDAQIEDWILDQFGYISELELKLRGIRISDFEVGAEVRTFIHPPEYNRASVAPAEYGGKHLGMVDLKGNGHSVEPIVNTQVKQAVTFKRAGMLDKLLIQDHNDGVASFGESISEVAKQRAEQAGYDLNYAKGQTVEHYFIIDSGFDILKPHGERIPAAIMGRQPCIQGNNFEGKEATKLYSDDHGSFQRSITGSTRDFGGHIVVIEDVKANFELKPGGSSRNPQSTKSWGWGHETAKAFRARANENIGEARGYIYHHFDDMLGPLTARWKRVRSFGAPSVDVQLGALLKAYFDYPNMLRERVNLIHKLDRVNDPAIYHFLVNYFKELSEEDLGAKSYYVSVFLHKLDGPNSPRLKQIFDELIFPGIRNGSINSAYVVQIMGGMSIPEDRKFFIEFFDGAASLDREDAKIFVELVQNSPYLHDPAVLKIFEEGRNALQPPFLNLIESAHIDTPAIRRLLSLNSFYSEGVQRILAGYRCTDLLKGAPIP